MLGSGTLADPYIIQNVNDLQDVRLLDAAYYELGNDIDASITSTWFGGRGFEPLDWPFPQKRRPTGDFSSTGVWTVQPAAPPTKFDKVNEIDPDGDTSYMRVTAAGGTVLFTSSNFNIPAGSTNIRLLPWIVWRDEGGAGNTRFRGYVRVNGVNYETSNYVQYGPNNIYRLSSAREFINNPATGAPWTADDINGVGANPLQAWGVVVSLKVCRITQIFAKVSCYPSVIFSFNGKSHTISNLYISRDGDPLTKWAGCDIGLFAECWGGEIKNLNLSNIDFKGHNDVGGIVGGGMLAPGPGISNCSVSGTIQASGTDAGGIAAWNGYAGNNIINCHFSGAITGVSSVGGIAGEVWIPSGGVRPKISDCSFNGQIIATGQRVGGIVGLATEFDLISCNSQGLITGAYVGGIAGELADGNITDCHSSANITGTSDYVGGLIGSAYLLALPPLSCSILRCQASGNVSAPPADGEVGGLVGMTYDYKIEQSFATGNVTGRHDIGGLVGSNGSFILNSYALGEVDGDFAAGGLVGYHYDYSIDKSYSRGLVHPGISEIGGFIGWNRGAIITNSFWDKDASGMTVGVGLGSSAGVEGKTTSEMNHLPIFADAGWDFTSIWNISRVSTVKAGSITAGSAVLDGLLDLTIINDAYPFFRWQTVVELPCDCGFEWGETDAFGNFTPVDSKNTGEPFAKPIAGLKYNTVYYYRALASASPGPIHGDPKSFTTLVGIEVETLPATNITENSARIWGRVRKVPITAMARFDWGGNIEYGAQTPWAPGLVSDDMFYHDLRNLAEGRAYHFRAVAMGSSLVYGNDMVFTTRSPVGPVVLIQEELAHLMEVS